MGGIKRKTVLDRYQYSIASVGNLQNGSGAAAREYAALPRTGVLYRHPWHLPDAAVTLQESMMQEPFLGEIRLFAGTYAPKGWAFCDGQLLQVRDNPQLFSILLNRYGGDGRTTFALPNLRGCTPLHPDPSTTPDMALGRKGGENGVKLIASSQIPRHAHDARATRANGTSPNPQGSAWGTRTGSAGFYSNQAPDTPMSSSALASSGSGQAHNNRQPFLGLHFVIALTGLYPTRG